MLTPSQLKIIADNYNNLSDYQKFINKNNENGLFDRIEKTLKDCAEHGLYDTNIYVNFGYDDPEKNYIVKYFSDLGFNTELVEPLQAPELTTANYRVYVLHLNWL